MRKLLVIALVFAGTLAPMYASDARYASAQDFVGTQDEMIAFWLLTCVQMMAQGYPGAYLAVMEDGAMRPYIANGGDKGLLSTPPSSAAKVALTVPAAVAAEMALICGDANAKAWMLSYGHDSPVTFATVVPLPASGVTLMENATYAALTAIGKSVAAHGLDEDAFYGAWEAQGVGREELAGRLAADPSPQAVSNLVEDGMRLMRQSPAATADWPPRGLVMAAYAAAMLAFAALVALVALSLQRRARDRQEP